MSLGATCNLYFYVWQEGTQYDNMALGARRSGPRVLDDREGLHCGIDLEAALKPPSTHGPQGPDMGQR
jgi:hypothetical protein